jgi:hypothetical protein
VDASKPKFSYVLNPKIRFRIKIFPKNLDSYNKISSCIPLCTRKFRLQFKVIIDILLQPYAVYDIGVRVHQSSNTQPFLTPEILIERLELRVRTLALVLCGVELGTEEEGERCVFVIAAGLPLASATLAALRIAYRSGHLSGRPRKNSNFIQFSLKILCKIDDCESIFKKILTQFS